MDNDSQLPVRALATEFTTEIANSTGTTINPAEEFAQGSTTSGQSGILIQGAVTTANPSYTTGQTSPLSLDVNGNLRTTSTFTPSGTQNVNVIQWDTTALGAPTAYGTPPSGNVIGVNADVTNTVAENLTQVGGAAIALGQTTMANSLPVVIASNQSAVPVTISDQTAVLTYFTDAAVASGATVTHSVAGPINLDKVAASGSGEIKLTVAIGITGSEVTYWNSFTSASNQDTLIDFNNNPYIIPTGSSVKVTIKNRDTAAQDVYLTFFTH